MVTKKLGFLQVKIKKNIYIVIFSKFKNEVLEKKTNDICHC